jgi:hypothetical protein
MNEEDDTRNQRIVAIRQEPPNAGPYEDVTTADDIIRIMMNIYGLTEQEARRAFSEVTAVNRWTDF